MSRTEAEIDARATRGMDIKQGSESERIERVG